MEELGRRLRERRETLGLTLEEVERTTRIRVPRLEALERGEFEAMPSEVQARGFLRNYADYLNLDAEDVLRQYDQARSAGAGGRGRWRAPSRVEPVTDRPSARARRPIGELLLSAAVTAGVAAVLIWGGWRGLALLNASGTATPEEAVPATEGGRSQSSPVPPTATQASPEPGRPAPVLPTATPTPTRILPVLDTVLLEILAEREAWVRVAVDGELAFEGRMRPGERLSFEGEDKIEVLTGNGGGLRVFFHGQDQGLMGDVGQVVQRLWSPRGMQTATPTPTMTPTETPEITETPTPSQTAESPTGA